MPGRNQKRLGRPPLPAAKRRRARVTLRLNAREQAGLSRLASRWDVSAGEALRRCLAKVAEVSKERSEAHSKKTTKTS